MYEIIVNPSSQSGNSFKVWTRVERVLKARNVEYRMHFTNHFGKDNIELTNMLDEYIAADETAHLVILGGDGSINGILQMIKSFRHVIISIIPCGSSNDLARDLGIKGSYESIMEHIIDNPTSISIDIGTVHCENRLVRDGAMNIPDRRFIVSTGIGYDAAVCEESFRSKMKKVLNTLGLGKLIYLYLGLKQLAATRYITGELTLNNDESNIIPLEKLLFLAGMNHKYEGGGFMFGPEANDHDGELQLVMLSRISKLRILSILPTAYRGNHVNYDGVDTFRARQYTVRTSEPLWVHTDGEVATKADFISVRMDQEALHFIY